MYYIAKATISSYGKNQLRDFKPYYWLTNDLSPAKIADDCLINS
jgi:hypothetical protein